MHFDHPELIITILLSPLYRLIPWTKHRASGGDPGARLAVNVAFVDIKSAFDSVDRIALWKALRAKGVPDILLQLIEDLHTHTPEQQ